MGEKKKDRANATAMRPTISTYAALTETSPLGRINSLSFILSVSISVI